MVQPVRVYLVGYIFCIIDCHICQNIFNRIDIMYCRLPYVSGGALPLKTLIFYIYRPRDTMQYNKQLYAIYSSIMVIISFFSLPILKIFCCLRPCRPEEINLNSTRSSTPGSLWILLIRWLSSLSRHHALADWKFLLDGGENLLPSTNSTRNTSM
jgi:hypothetical protein